MQQAQAQPSSSPAQPEATKSSFADRLKQKGGGLLDKIIESVVEEVKNPSIARALEWTQAAAEQVWESYYTEQISTESGKTVYRNAKISLDPAQDQLQIVVNSSYASAEIQKNSQLLGLFKQKFAKPSLSFQIQVVESPEQAEQRRRATLSPEDRKREDERLYLEQNPLLQKLKELLGLEIKKIS